MKKLKYGLAFIALMNFSAQAEILQDIRISGTRRIENSTVMNYLRLKKGQNISEEVLENARKTLFATGLFSDVSAEMRNGVANIVVEENPIVHEVYFEGNKLLDDDALKSEVMLKSRDVYTQYKLERDAARLLDVYKRHGRFAASVEP